MPEPIKTASSKWWRPAAVFPILGLMVLLFWGISGNAATPAKPKAVKAAAITAEWKVLPIAEAGREPIGEAVPLPDDRVSVFTGHFFSLQRLLGGPGNNELKAPPALAVLATLRDASGAPISFKPVEFSLQTEFGVLPFGSRPTMADGKAQLVIKDHRYGSYPVQVAFHGDEDYAAAAFKVNVDFGARPAPSLPQSGILITPYATPHIAVPFLAFYGTMWVAFVYTFGYLILWKMRRGLQPAKSTLVITPLPAASPFDAHQVAQPNLHLSKESL